MKRKAVVIGGSVAGVSCALALIKAGWDVVVIEKTGAPPTRSPTGAGLGLDPQAQEYIQSWIAQPDLLHNMTLPLTIEQNQVVTDGHEKKTSSKLTRDEDFNFRTAYWADLYNLLYRALPDPNIVLWGYHFLSFCISSNKDSVTIKAEVLATDEIIEIVGDLLVAADGCHSSIRKHFLPDFKLRYSGYTAWRGVYDFSENVNCETITCLRKLYPDLGRCLYFELDPNAHSAFQELPNNRINWIWYFNQPEPQLKGNSVTMKVDREMINKMHLGAEKVWVPEVAMLMKETKEPFINVIYDGEPLKQLVWDDVVVLIGDAAHPTTPHCLRSTNMSILDSAVLGKCLEKRGSDNLGLALKEFELIRLPVVSEQVLHSRKMGRIKQGLDRIDCTKDYHLLLQQRNMPFFTDAPVTLDDQVDDQVDG